MDITVERHPNGFYLCHIRSSRHTYFDTISWHTNLVDVYITNIAYFENKEADIRLPDRWEIRDLREAAIHYLEGN